MQRLAKHVVLIAWPGADWKTISRLVDSGFMPNAQQLIEAGTLAPVSALAPLGPPLYTSIVTGFRADRHQILTSADCDPRTGRLRPPLSTKRRKKALWNILSTRRLRSLVVGWPAQYPVEAIEGVSVSADLFDTLAPPGMSGTAPPDSVFPVAYCSELAKLCVHPTELQAGDLFPFLPDLAAIDQRLDPRVRILTSRLARSIGAHAVTTHLMEREAWDFLAVTYGPIEMASFESPQATRFATRTVEAAYRFSDMMLGRLMELSGEDSLFILSSAGGTAHSSGFFCIAGPGVKKDEWLHGATLLDIAPTVLFALGCPVGRDMQGVPLTTAFLDPPNAEYIASWEATDLHLENTERDQAQSWIAQLEALGYRDPQAEHITANSARIQRERELNLAAVYMSTGRAFQAIEVLERLRARSGDDETCLLGLSYAYLVTGAHDPCRALLPEISENERTKPLLILMRAFIAAVEGKRKQALALLQQAESDGGPFPLLSYAIGCIYLGLGKCEQAEAAFRAAAELRPNYWRAEQGRAAALRRLGRLQEAAEAVRSSLSLNFVAPESHSLLAVTLLALGDHARAVEAFRTAGTLSRTGVR